WLHSGELPGGLDAVHAGHADVHQHDIGDVFSAGPHRLGAVGCGGDDVEVGLCVEQVGEAGADDLGIGGDADADRGTGHAGSSALAGSTASTTKPPPAAEPVRSWPPTAAARSRMPSSPCPASGAVVGGPGPLSRMRRCRVSSV